MIAKRSRILDDLPFVRQRFESTGGVLPDDTAVELDRFFELTTLVNMPMAVISSNVDKLWHRLIEFTEYYKPFCIGRYGTMIHHRSRTDMTPVEDSAVRNFYDAYEQRFGALPQIWELHAPIELIASGRRQIDSIPASLAWSGWPGRNVVDLVGQEVSDQGASQYETPTSS